MSGKMDAELKAKWVKALRSGEYKQGFSSFEKEGRFCCLGVLCKIMNEPTQEPATGLNNWDVVHEHLGRDYGVVDELWHRNDGVYSFGGKRHSFSEIADYIEENL